MSYDAPVTAPTVAGLRAPQNYRASTGGRVSENYGSFPKLNRCLMLHYAVVFFVIALIAAFFGFGGIAVGAAGIAKVLFIVFLIGAIVSFLMSLGRRV
jgi:uncharacterized membrane protein YtjA (UPF0391 family)